MSCLKTKLTSVELLLSCLLTLSGITLGHENDVVEVIAAEGSDAILPCSLSTKERITSKVFDWKKDGQKEVFLYDAGIHYNNGRSGQDEQFKGRVSHFPGELKSGNASIIIRNTRMEDSGLYTCFFPRLQPSQLFHIKLVVVGDVVEVVVEEGSDAILPCSLSTKERITSKVFDWKKDHQKEVFFYDAGIHYNNGRSGQDEQFKGRVSHFPGELKSGNASIIIRNTRMEDSGNYTCVFPRLQPSQLFHIKLVVGERTFKDRSGEIRAAAIKPYVTSLNQTKDWALLQCEVRNASPKPKLHWQDSDGNIFHAEEPKESERGGSYDIILQTTVTKTNIYRCVATQEEIKHQIYAETYVFIHEKLVGDKSSHGAVVFVGGWFSGALTVAAVLGLFDVAKWIIKHRKKAAATKSSVKRLDETKELKLMSCEVPNVTPQSLWQDSDGHVLPDEDHRFSSEK